MSFSSSNREVFHGLLRAIAQSDESPWCFVRVGSNRIAVWSARIFDEIPSLRPFFLNDVIPAVDKAHEDELRSALPEDISAQWTELLATESSGPVTFYSGRREWDVTFTVVMDRSDHRIGRLLRFSDASISRTVNELKVRSREAQERLQLLSPREKEVVYLVYEGLTNSMIADQKSISHKTVEKHRDRINQKLRARHVVDVVRVVADSLLFDARSSLDSEEQ